MFDLFLLFNCLEREGSVRVLDVCTRAKVPTSRGLINCMAKKKGHLSATPYLDHTQKTRHVRMWAHALPLALSLTHKHTHIQCSKLTSHSNTLDWLELPWTVSFFHPRHVLSCQSANEVFDISSLCLTVGTALVFMFVLYGFFLYFFFLGVCKFEGDVSLS